MTVIKTVKKPKKRIRAESLLDKTSNNNSTIYSAVSDNTKEKTTPKKEEEKIPEETKKEKIINKAKLDSRNLAFEEYEKNQMNIKIPIIETIRKNKEYIKTMKRKPNPDGHFCRPYLESTSDEDVHFYSPIKNNYYVGLIDRM